MTQTIFDDGLNKDTLFQRINQVRYGILFALWTLQARVGRQPHDTWQDNLNVHEGGRANSHLTATHPAVFTLEL